MSGLSDFASRLLARFTARQTTPGTPGPRVVYLPRSATGGVQITPDEALRVSAVWACVQTVAKAIASSPWQVLEETDDGRRTLRRDLRLWRMLNVRPNPEITGFSLKETIMNHALVWGNAFVEIERSTRGEPLALWPIEPERCILERSLDPPFRLELRVSNPLGGQVVLPYRDVLHVRGPSLDGVSGMPVWMYAARTLGKAAAIETFGQSFFANNLSISGFLTPEGFMDRQQMEQVIQSLQEQHRGPQRAHRWAVLRGGLKFQPASVEPEKAQLVESEYLAIENVCRWFGVPPHKVAHLLRATFSNIEEQEIHFVIDTLTPWAERLRLEADAKLLPFGNRLLRTRFELDWLREGRAEDTARADAQLVTNGIMTRNEARAKRGMNAAAGEHADALTVQSQNVLLDGVPEGPLMPQDAMPEEGGPDAVTDTT